MGTAAQIRNHRVRAGKSPGQVARQLGLNDAWYGDLERHDDELVSTLSVFQAMELASALNVRLRELLGEQAAPGEGIPLIDLPARIKAHVAGKGMSIEQFEEEIGWGLQEFLQSPAKVAAESPIVFLQAVAKPLGIDWLSLVPEELAD
jgi:hypothetical protein